MHGSPGTRIRSSQPDSIKNVSKFICLQINIVKQVKGGKNANCNKGSNDVKDNEWIDTG